MSMENRYVIHSQKIPLSKGFLYTGEDVSLQRKVILYTVDNNERGPSDAYIDKIRRASSLTHDGFQHILDTSFGESSLLVVLKHRPGKPLIQELGNRTWTFPQVISLVTDLGVCLLDAMEEQITGFSVVAENLWLGEDGRLSVINYWEDGEPQTQGAIGLCGLMIQLFSNTAEIPGFFEALDLHLGRIALLQATSEQKEALIKLARRVCQGQSSLPSFIFSLQSMPQMNTSNGEGRTATPPVQMPAAATLSRRTQQQPVKPVAKEDIEEVDDDEEEEEKRPFYKKPLVGVSGLIIVVLFVWVLWPSHKADKHPPVPTSDSSKPLSTPESTMNSQKPQSSATPSDQGNGSGQGEEITIPNLVGMTQADAEKQALASGLHYKYVVEVNPQADGSVFKQDLEAGTKGMKGDNIIFWVGKASQ
jgi:hypothetical protein